MEKSYKVTHCEDIVENIFGRLLAKDLCKCACVCKFWNFMAKSKLEENNKIVHFYQDGKITVGGGTEIDKYQPSRSFEVRFRHLLRNLRMKPAICIAFATSQFWDKFEDLFPSHQTSRRPKKRFKKMYDDDSRQKYFESVLQTILRNNLPRQCEISLYVGNGIISSFDTVHGCKEAKAVFSAAITGYFLPESSREAIQLCKRKEYGGEVLKVLSNKKDLQTALVLVEHRFLPYTSIALHELKNHLWKQKFDMFGSGVVMPVQVGSNNVPIFWGPQLQVNQAIPENSNNDTIAFVFQGAKLDSIRNMNRTLRQHNHQIPIAGLIGESKVESDSYKEREFFKKWANDHTYYKSLYVTFKHLKTV